MTNTKQELIAIRDGAPDGATHYDDSGVYYRYADTCEYDVFMAPDSGACWRRMPDGVIESPAVIHNLNDLREILKLREQIDALKSNLEEISEAGCLGEVAKILRNCGIDYAN